MARTVLSIWGGRDKVVDEAVAAIEATGIPYRVVFTRDCPGSVVLVAPFGEIVGIGRIRKFAERAIAQRGKQ